MRCVILLITAQPNVGSQSNWGCRSVSENKIAFYVFQPTNLVTASFTLDRSMLPPVCVANPTVVDWPNKGTDSCAMVQWRRLKRLQRLQQPIYHSFEFSHGCELTAERHEKKGTGLWCNWARWCPTMSSTDEQLWNFSAEFFMQPCSAALLRLRFPSILEWLNFQPAIGTVRICLHLSTSWTKWSNTESC